MQDIQFVDDRPLAKYNLTRPEEIINFSKELVKFIKDTQLSTSIQGQKYANVDAWKFAGLNFGLVPIVGEPIQMHKDGQRITILYHEIEVRTSQGKKRMTLPYFASSNDALIDKYRKDTTIRELTTDYFNYKTPCEIISHVSGQKVGAGFGLCSNLELKKVTFEEYAVMSMSQTRAIGRGYKNVIGFIMKAAGYAPTPFEEMDNDPRIITLDEGTALDIDALLDGCKSVSELTKVWEGLTAQHQSSRLVLNKFKKKKLQLKQHGSK